MYKSLRNQHEHKAYLSANSPLPTHSRLPILVPSAHYSASDRNVIHSYFSYLHKPHYHILVPIPFSYHNTNYLRLSFASYPQWSSVQKDRKSTRLNSSHANISYAVFCLKKKKKITIITIKLILTTKKINKGKSYDYNTTCNKHNKYISHTQTH